MPYFNEEWLHELQNRIDIVDIVGSYVQLKNKGGRWWACCPFHNEKTPSFTVNPERGFFHCFGCGKSGNAIQFVMELDKMTFPEACAYLAEKVKLPVPENSGDADYEKKKALREKIYKMNRAMAAHYHACLMGEGGVSAREYLKNRGITERIVKTFGMGWAPDAWDTAVTLLEKEGYTKSDMMAAGLVKVKDSRYFDMFRSRVIIPIIDARGQVIGFGGRILGDGVPKYLNSPETPAFYKGRSLYNLNIVRKLKNLSRLILVEGYMDVIALHAAGVTECVATLGTALTKDQARLIKKYVKSVYISYDGDEAGQKAALRALDVLSAEGLTCRVVTVPGGQDPDDFLRANGKEGYLKLLKVAQPVLDYKFSVIAKKYDLQDEQGKLQYAKECVGLLQSESSAMVREKYVGKLSAQTGISEQAILADAAIAPEDTAAWKRPAPARQPEQPKADLKAEDRLMALLCAYPQYMGKLEGEIERTDLRHKTNEKIFSFILGSLKKGVSPSGAEILSVLDKEDELAHTAVLLNMDMEAYADGETAGQYLNDCATRIKIRNCEEKRLLLLRQAGALEGGEKVAAMAEIGELQQSVYQLKQKLRGMTDK